MSHRRERVSYAVIELALGMGGSFLAAAFALEAYRVGDFLIPASVITFVLIAAAVRAFGRVRLRTFTLATATWFVVLYLIRP